MIFFRIFVKNYFWTIVYIKPVIFFHINLHHSYIYKEHPVYIQVTYFYEGFSWGIRWEFQISSLDNYDSQSFSCREVAERKENLSKFGTPLQKNICFIKCHIKSIISLMYISKHILTLIQRLTHKSPILSTNWCKLRLYAKLKFRVKSYWYFSTFGFIWKQYVETLNWNFKN